MTDVDVGADRGTDADKVRQAVLDHLKVHVRVSDQERAPQGEELRALVAAMPALSAFGDHAFHGVRAVLDWDHQIPGQYVLLRILASYDAATTEQIDADLAERDAAVADGNLYPEFDVPDYAGIEASEQYVGVLRPQGHSFEDFRFISDWRKHVPDAQAEAAAKTARADTRYRLAEQQRSSEGLGGPVVIGWAPPCVADSDHWAIEIWLLTEFDGHVGKARVFMVDNERGAVTREFDTDVQLA